MGSDACYRQFMSKLMVNAPESISHDRELEKMHNCGRWYHRLLSIRDIWITFFRYFINLATIDRSDGTQNNE
jgi:hypothetical protein